jgi:ABC-type multidrug transport system fused ATPase/permease subunit
MTLKNIFIKNWKRLSLTYALFNIENILSLAKPYFLGKAIDMTIKSDKNGIIMFLGVYCLFAIVGGIRRIYDTRTFTKIYSEVAVEIVKNQHLKEVSASKISARTTLSSKFVDFFETDVTVFFQTLYNIFGSLILLFLYMKSLLFYCLAIIVPIAIINKIYAKKNMILLKLYNNQLEKSVDNIVSKDSVKVVEHYNLLKGLRIKISDNEAYNFLMAEIFIIFLIGASLSVFYGNSAISVGAIVAIFQYVNMFILGLDDVPYLIEQINKIKDIQKRIFEK